MQTQREDSVSSADDVRMQLIGRLRTLVDQTANGNGWADGLMEALLLLNSLPLSTHDFAVAAKRLSNARGYVDADEHGAARYELRLVLGSLNNSNEDGPIRRRLRNRSDRIP